MHLLEDLGESDSCLGEVMKGAKKGEKKHGTACKIALGNDEEKQKLTALSSAQVNDVQI
jgi:hypothetical protein